MAEERAARSVFVGNIPYEATEEQLKEIFNQAGTVVSFRLVYDRETGKPKGYGFCEYQDLETAQCAMRNLNNHDFNGRPLRVGVAAGEQGKDEGRLMQPGGGPMTESPFGEPVDTEKAPEAISRAVASLPPEQMFELMKQMKLCIQNNPNEARNMLLQNPQLAYALLQAQIVMKIVDPQVALAMLHRPTEQIPPLLPSTSPSTGATSAPPSASSQALLNPSSQNMEVRPGFFPSVPIGRGVPLLGPGPGPGHGSSGGPRIGPGGMMGNNNVPGLPGNMGPGPEFGARGPMPGPRIRGGLLGDMPSGERRDGPGLTGPRGPVGFVGDPRVPARGEMGGREPSHHMLNMGGPGPRPDMGPGIGPGIRPDVGMGPRRELGPGMGMGPGPRPRMDMGPGARMDMGPRDIDSRPRPVPPMMSDVREPRPDSDMRPNRMQPMPSTGPAPRPAGPSASPTISGAQISPQDQEKAALIMQVLQLSDEQIAMLPPDQRQSILILKDQIARSANK